jgi:hypothetical protein
VERHVYPNIRQTNVRDIRLNPVIQVLDHNKFDQQKPGPVLAGFGSRWEASNATHQAELAGSRRKHRFARARWSQLYHCWTLSQQHGGPDFAYGIDVRVHRCLKLIICRGFNVP